ncbi:mannose-1-phosphate guanylyltransferase/mannose-6-phosphate isomerase [Prochlorococcus marinus]|jgi:mannose-1-phosphate guanylyltransferase|uniref:mannose-1-phosphate guanylyltransferase n=1 Tax=Prochlorococcus marinus (strain MIT 9301) TaxID=167546 RepID=A3PE81_PROM0|nr:mannose-1-phosphate guanylyltransferase/mannose-6-phosphate isomerase [Prochlorococcus marinus]ABO18056.1 Mannose-1-phosphate guanylyltransferase [Prochlorococcus marinus str. MIT 9301]
MHKKDILPVILCGGRGSRLWPLSRSSYPKQFISFSSQSSFSLLQKTIKRLSNFDNIDNPILICNEEHRFITAEQVKSIGVKPKSILLEPFGKGTTAAIALAALKAIENNTNPKLLILSSDHEIGNLKNFKESIKEGLSFADDGRLVTFGIMPTYAETGFGYIKTNEKLEAGIIKGYEIKKFVEKPNYEKAKEFVRDKHYVWNSGIFLFKATKILEEIKNHAPNTYEICAKSINVKNLDLDFQRIDRKIFSNCKESSIDISIMEKTKLGTMIPMDANWRDIGSWDQVWENSTKDKNGNSKRGNVILKEVKNSLFISENRLVVGLGVEELILIETSDAILVLNKRFSQKVKNIVEQFDKTKNLEGFEHKKIYRPWGNYESLVEDEKWKVKKIIVKPNQSLSLQSHKHRSEHWIVVRGIAKVEISENIFYLNENESAYIPKKALHRLSNPGNEILIIIEVQTGSYLGEDDIKRIEDYYGRVTNKD